MDDINPNPGARRGLLRWIVPRKTPRPDDHSRHHGGRSSMQSIWTSLVTAMLTAGLFGIFSNVVSIEDMTIFYRLLNPSEIGRAKLKVTFSISNMGRQGALIEELGMISVVGPKIDTEKANCSNKELLSIVDALGIGEVTEWQNNRLSYHLPEEIHVDNSKALSGSVALNAGTARKLDTTFALPPLESPGHSVLLCPLIKYFDRFGRAIWSVCPGWARDGTTNSFTQGLGNDSRRLLPAQGSLLNWLFWRSGDQFCVSQP